MWKIRNGYCALSVVIKLVIKSEENAGCQYLFLFAADTSEDGSLINYYDVALKFKKPTEIGTNKPRYDFCCEFMCEDINELKKNQQAYFDNFNPDHDDVIA